MSAASFNTLDPSKAVPSMHTASGTAMRKSGEKIRHHGLIDTQMWVDEWRRIHPSKPTQFVAASLGAPAKTVEKWFAGTSSPSLTWVGPIFSAYGPDFVLAGMRNAPPWLREAARNEKRRRLAAAMAAVEAEFSDLEYAEVDA